MYHLSCRAPAAPDLPALIQFPTPHLQKQHSEWYYRAEQRHLNKDVFQLMFNGKKLFMVKKYSRNQKLCSMHLSAPFLMAISVNVKCRILGKTDFPWKKILIFPHTILSAAMATANSLYSKDTTIVLLMSYRMYFWSVLQLYWSERL